MKLKVNVSHQILGGRSHKNISPLLTFGDFFALFLVIFSYSFRFL